jgi:hypothetical protein
MNGSIHGWVSINGQIKRWGMAKPETVADHLATLATLDDTLVCFQQYGAPQLLTAQAFLTRYAQWRERRCTVFT